MGIILSNNAGELAVASKSVTLSWLTFSTCWRPGCHMKWLPCRLGPGMGCASCRCRHPGLSTGPDGGGMNNLPFGIRDGWKRLFDVSIDRFKAGQ